uniref:NADH-ubiquinone oxidoreductase chain 4L n=1 Tax=Porcellio dilatatus dilatatus TaxID=96810 RepID=A0A1P8DKF3_PORDI|nr:NADH dehydrogenase subunit 4L [Porcellio dilatatus dilatatus]
MLTISVMNLISMFMVMYMFTFLLLCFAFEFKHLLSSLVCLEFMALVIFMSLSVVTYSFASETLYSLMYLSVAVCEAALGLSITVLYTLKKGNEMLKTC